MYWHKNSAEYKALAYKLTTLLKKLELELSKDYEKPLAIIADLDETIFDNTPYNEMLINENKSYDQENWSDWVNKEIATAVPGSLDFLIMLNHWGLKLFIFQIEGLKTMKQLSLILLNWGSHLMSLL